MKPIFQIVSHSTLWCPYYSYISIKILKHSVISTTQIPSFLYPVNQFGSRVSHLCRQFPGHTNVLSRHGNCLIRRLIGQLSRYGAFERQFWQTLGFLKRLELLMIDRRVSTFRGAGAFSKEDTLYYSRGYRGARPSYAWACYIGHRHHSQPVIRTRTHTRTRAYPQPWFRIIVVATETRVTEYGTVKVLRLFPWCSRFLQLWTPIDRTDCFWMWKCGHEANNWERKSSWKPLSWPFFKHEAWMKSNFYDFLSFTNVTAFWQMKNKNDEKNKETKTNFWSIFKVQCASLVLGLFKI